MKLYIGQVPALPLTINVKYADGSAVDFSLYTTCVVKITSPYGAVIVNLSSPIAGLIDGSSLVFSWSSLGVNTSTFVIPGDYSVKIYLTNASPLVNDITSSDIIRIYKEEV